MFEYEDESIEYTLDALLECNSENEVLCHWLRTAFVGQTFGGFKRVD